MSSNSRKDRERLKEEYKAHYRKMREVKERLNRAKKKKNITDALRDMDTSDLMGTFDDFLFNVKSKIANVEARLDVAMDSLSEGGEDVEESIERDEELQKEKARETLKQAKIEMGLLYNQIEEQADAINVKKTIGTDRDDQEDETQSG